MSEVIQKPEPRTGLLIWLIVSQVIVAASLLIWLLVAVTFVMAFDSGQSRDAWTFVIAVWSYPVFPIAMGIDAWMAYLRRKNVLAAILSGLTFAPQLLLYLGMWVGSAVWFLRQ